MTANPHGPRRRRLLTGLLVASLVLNIGLGLLWSIDRDSDGADDVVTADQATSTTMASTTTTLSATTTTTTTSTTTLPPEVGPVRILVVGDSVASQIGWALQGWSEEHPGEVVVFNEAHIGCGVVRYGFKRVDGLDGPVGDICSNWNDPVALHLAAETEIVSWPSAIELFEPDIVLATVSSWDATDRIVPDVVDDWSAIGDPRYDAYVLNEYTEAASVLAASGADVYWLPSPYLAKDLLPIDHVERIDGLNALATTAMRLVDASSDADIEQVDYPGWLGEVGAARDRELRDDGVHLSIRGQAEIAPWLIEEIGLS
ncbi:MAG: hypothetical protein RIB98_03625 [Acidimicrobiales bacterium]